MPSASRLRSVFRTSRREPKRCSLPTRSTRTTVQFIFSPASPTEKSGTVERDLAPRAKRPVPGDFEFSSDLLCHPAGRHAAHTGLDDLSNSGSSQSAFWTAAGREQTEQALTGFELIDNDFRSCRRP